MNHRKSNIEGGILWKTTAEAVKYSAYYALDLAHIAHCI